MSKNIRNIAFGIGNRIDHLHQIQEEIKSQETANPFGVPVSDEAQQTLNRLRVEAFESYQKQLCEEIKEQVKALSEFADALPDMPPAPPIVEDDAKPAPKVSRFSAVISKINGGQVWAVTLFVVLMLGLIQNTFEAEGLAEAVELTFLFLASFLLGAALRQSLDERKAK